MDQTPSTPNLPGAPVPASAMGEAYALSVRSPREAESFIHWRERVGDDEVISHLCDYIVEDGHLAGFCRLHLFSYTTVQRWIDANNQRAVMYARACEDRAEVQADKILDVARRDCSTPIMGEDSDGRAVVLGRKVDPAAVQQAKLESDNLKWLASKTKPRKYGDKLAVDQTVNVRELTDKELVDKLGGLGGPAFAAVAAATLGLSLPDQPEERAVPRVGTAA